jgi:hypothetical protein
VTFDVGSRLETIGESAFGYCHSLQSICIPASVTSINYLAFYGCKALTNVEFEAGSQVKTIENNAFAACSSLKKITLPDSVEKICGDAFNTSTPININLANKSVYISDDKDINVVRQALTETFLGNKEILLEAGSTVHIRDSHFSNWKVNKDWQFEFIPSAGQEGAQYIASARPPSEFRYEQGIKVPLALRGVFIPKNVEVIEAEAFSGKENLIQVRFEAGSQVKTVGSDAFGNCKSLQSICIPASVEMIEAGAFINCNQLKTITFESKSNLKEIELGAFAGCSLEQIVIPDSVEKISAAVFAASGSINIELSMKSLNVSNPEDEDEVYLALTRICLGFGYDLALGTTVLIRDGDKLSNWRVNEDKLFELIKQ